MKARKTLLSALLATAVVLSPWQAGLLPAPLDRLDTAPAGAQNPPPPGVEEGTVEPCPDEATADPTDRSLCMTSRPPCPESLLVPGSDLYMALSHQWPDFCEESVIEVSFDERIKDEPINDEPINPAFGASVGASVFVVCARTRNGEPPSAGSLRDGFVSPPPAASDLINSTGLVHERHPAGWCSFPAARNAASVDYQAIASPFGFSNPYDVNNLYAACREGKRTSYALGSDDADSYPPPRIRYHNGWRVDFDPSPEPGPGEPFAYRHDDPENADRAARDDSPPWCRLITPARCIAGMHRVSRNECRSYDRRTWTCPPGTYRRNEFNSCYRPSSDPTDLQKDACGAGAPMFPVGVCEDYVGTDDIAPLPVPDDPGVPVCGVDDPQHGSLEPGDPPDPLEPFYPLVGTATRALIDNQDNRHWCRYNAALLDARCYDSDGIYDANSVLRACKQLAALCLRRASKTGGCNAVVTTILCRSLEGVYIHRDSAVAEADPDALDEAAIDALENARRAALDAMTKAGCAPCVAVPYVPPPSHCGDAQLEGAPASHGLSEDARKKLLELRRNQLDGRNPHAVDGRIAGLLLRQTVWYAGPKPGGHTGYCLDGTDYDYEFSKLLLKVWEGYVTGDQAITSRTLETSLTSTLEQRLKACREFSGSIIRTPPKCRAPATGSVRVGESHDGLLAVAGRPLGVNVVDLPHELTDVGGFVVKLNGDIYYRKHRYLLPAEGDAAIPNSLPPGERIISIWPEPKDHGHNPGPRDDPEPWNLQGYYREVQNRDWGGFTGYTRYDTGSDVDQIRGSSDCRPIQPPLVILQARELWPDREEDREAIEDLFGSKALDRWNGPGPEHETEQEKQERQEKLTQRRGLEWLGDANGPTDPQRERRKTATVNEALCSVLGPESAPSDGISCVWTPPRAGFFEVRAVAGWVLDWAGTAKYKRGDGTNKCGPICLENELKSAVNDPDNLGNCDLESLESYNYFSFVNQIGPQRLVSHNLACLRRALRLMFGGDIDDATHDRDFALRAGFSGDLKSTLPDDKSDFLFESGGYPIQDIRTKYGTDLYLIATYSESAPVGIEVRDIAMVGHFGG